MVRHEEDLSGGESWVFSVDRCEMSDVLLYGIWFSEEQLGRNNNIELYCWTDSRAW